MYNVQIWGDWKHTVFQNPIQKKVKRREKKKKTIPEENKKDKINGKFELTYVSNNVKCK